MKFLTILLLFISIIAYSQKQDSLTKKLNYIQLNLENYHDEHNYGTSLIFSGLIIGAGGYTIYKCLEYPTYQVTSRKPSIGPSFMVVGSVMIITGYAFQINSHKFLKRISLYGTGVKINL